MKDHTVHKIVHIIDLLAELLWHWTWRGHSFKFVSYLNIREAVHKWCTDGTWIDLSAVLHRLCTGHSNRFMSYLSTIMKDGTQMPGQTFTDLWHTNTPICLLCYCDIDWAQAGHSNKAISKNKYLKTFFFLWIRYPLVPWTQHNACGTCRARNNCHYLTSRAQWSIG